MADLYEDLGVPRDATPQELKQAYRRKAMRTHPDRHGGSKEDFSRLRLAYTVLSDPERRQKYDRDGTLEHEISGELQTLAQMLIGIAEGNNEDQVDLISALRMEVQKGIQGHTKMKESWEAKAKKFHKLAKRVKHKKEGERNLFANMLEAHAKQAEENIEIAKKHIKFGQRMLDMLADYESPIDLAEIIRNEMLSSITFTISTGGIKP